MSAFIVGQAVFVVRPGRRGFGPDAQTSHATITAIGRRWATLDNRTRFDMDTLQLDGPGIGYGPGRVYVSASDWEREHQTQAAWDALTRRIRDSYRVPDGITLAQIEAATAALGWTRSTSTEPAA